MGIDNVNVHLHAHLEVSIHAPTRGATVYYILLYITTGCNTVFAKELNAVTNP